MSKFWETTERAYCYNCKYFHTDVMQGDKPIEFVGTCNNPKQSRSRTEADDMCPLYKCAQWAKKESPETYGNLETCDVEYLAKLEIIGNIHEMEVRQ